MCIGADQDSAGNRDYAAANQGDADAAIAALPYADGDIAFRRGHDVMSRLVLSQSGEVSRYSHVGIVVRKGDDAFVVHSMPGEMGRAGGVTIESVRQFASPLNASGFALYRLPALSDEQREAIRTYAITQVGKPFDDQFLLGESDKLYCSELVMKALRAAGSGTVSDPPLVQVMMVAEPVLTPDSLRNLPQVTMVGEFHVAARN